MQHGGKRITGNVIGKLGLLLAGLVVAEASLQVLVYLAPMKFRTALTEATSYDFRDENIGWQRRFLARYGKLDQQSIPMSQNEYVTHPVLGWMPKPNLSITNSIGQTYTTNSRGFRSPHEFERSADKYTVLVVGDSFTYGSWADDTEVWPTLLEGLDPEINLLNFGVAGFGVDQMSLMLEMQIEEFAPDLVIAAFISDDLHRTTLCFRDYWKPMYVIQNNDLVLTNTPIPELAEGVSLARENVRQMHRMTRLNWLKVTGLTTNMISRLRQPPRSEFNHAGRPLNRRIFEKMLALCRSHDAQLLMLYLPEGKELVDGSFETRGGRFLADFSATHKVESLNPRSNFLAKKQRYSGGHYRYPGAMVVAEAVFDSIRGLPSYRNWRSEAETRPLP